MWHPPFYSNPNSPVIMPFRCIDRVALFAVVSTILVLYSGYAGTTGKIAGRVTDSQSKEGLVGVNVVLAGSTLGAATDVEGNYFINNIPPGTYQVKASAIGYTAVSVNEVKVFVDQTTRLDFTLQSQAVEIGGVEVTATRPIVQRDLTSTTATISSDRITALPVEDVAALVNLQAGVVEGHFRGGRSGEVKYLIDGLPVNDVYSGASTLQPEVNSVQEIQVLSGTFNAEYGEALSGVVNQITKVASEKFSGQFSTYTGDYVSTRRSLFQNVDHISPSNLSNFDGSLTGPVPGTDNRVKYFLSGRFFYDDGYLYGRRIFNPFDSSNFSANNPKDWYIGATGDGKFVPMNFQKRYTLQGKLNFAMGNSKGITLQGIYQQHDYRDYNHQYRIDPDGDYLRFEKSFLGTANYNYVLNDASFIDFNAAMFNSDYKQYVYENPLDPRYVSSDRVKGLGPNSFLTGGTQNWHFLHHTNTYTGKVDFTDQITRIHEIKTGGEARFHVLRYQDYQIHVDASSGFKPALSAPGSFDNNSYRNQPYQLAGYLQDKIEFDYLIINVGLRYDYFQPDGKTLRNPDNIAQLDTLSPPYPDSVLVSARGKSQFSPRIGISYPISDKGALHISYGHFFQIPAFEFLYKNPTFRIPVQGGFPEFVGDVIGNADLEPQRTTMYEVGLQQELAPNIGMTITAFSKDIRNLLGIEVHYKGNVRKFGAYVNRDYGSVRGFTVSFERRLVEGFGASIDYTYQIAKGNSSNPNDDYLKQQATPPIPINTQLVPLDWDRRHSLNFSVTAGSDNNFIGSLTCRLGSGLPYSPSKQNASLGLENSDNRPSFFNADLYVTKYLNFLDHAFSVFFKVYNVFDTQNELNVFTDTGRAGYTLETNSPRGVNTLEEYLTRPDFYSAPRQVIVGAALSF